MTDLDVRADALRAHASTLGESAEHVGEAATAALAAVALQPVAFGLLCSFLVPVVSAQQSTAIAGFAALGGALAAEATAVSAAGIAYSALDDNLAAAIARVV